MVKSPGAKAPPSAPLSPSRPGLAWPGAAKPSPPPGEEPKPREGSFAPGGRGFLSMTPARLKEVAASGGRAVPSHVRHFAAKEGAASRAGKRSAEARKAKKGASGE